MQDLPLLIVALMVFGGVFAFAWNLDARAKRLEGELRSELDELTQDNKAK